MQLKFGKYKSQEISDVAKTNDGCAYLDWLRMNTDVKDPKYGKTNQILFDEINKALDGKTIYKPEKKEFKKSGNSPEVLSKLEEIHSDIKIIKQKLGITGKTEVLTNDEGTPF